MLTDLIQLIQQYQEVCCLSLFIFSPVIVDFLAYNIHEFIQDYNSPYNNINAKNIFIISEQKFQYQFSIFDFEYDKLKQVQDAIEGPYNNSRSYLSIKNKAIEYKYATTSYKKTMLPDLEFRDVFNTVDYASRYAKVKVYELFVFSNTYFQIIDYYFKLDITSHIANRSNPYMNILRFRHGLADLQQYYNFNIIRNATYTYYRDHKNRDYLALNNFNAFYGGYRTDLVRYNKLFNTKGIGELIEYIGKIDYTLADELYYFNINEINREYLCTLSKVEYINSNQILNK